ncbi:MAG: Crp/Fnr family transcriptional regulator [Oscillospiraceae bacterium]|nr:Crp/Fnr family transcriptional regulator [Oscillospiraceae bacterium]
MEKKLSENQILLIAKNPVFQSVPLEVLQPLLEQNIQLRSFKKGEIIYSPNHFEESMGLFLTGTAVAEKSNGSVILNTFAPGSCFGVATLFSHSRRYVTTVKASSDCLVAFFSGEAMTRLFREEPQISLNYIGFLASRIHFLNRKIDQFTAVSAEEKLVLWLLEQAEQENPFQLSISYAKLADMLDLGRSSLYRALDALEACGILHKEGKLLTVLDMERLENWNSTTA